MNEHRVAVGVAIVLGLVALSARDFAVTYRTWRAWPPPHVADDITLTEQNCARVRDQLPPGGAVGYRDRTKGDAVGAGRRHGLFQYALAPLLLEPGADRPVTVEVSQVFVRVVRRGGP